MTTIKKDILLLYDRPCEPVYVPKGDQNLSFNVPSTYLPDRYQPMAVDIFNRFNGENDNKINIKQINLPDLRIPMRLGRRDNFSLFIPFHRKIAGRLIDIFVGMKTYDDFLSVAAYSRDRLNPNMFIYCLSVAILHRPDTKNLTIPSLCEVFPDKYLDGAIFSRAREEANLIPAGSREPIEIPLNYTASDRDTEHRVAYFREDIGVNLHHWHWHLVYPFEASTTIVNKDRRGELFYFMHQQLMARYNVERLCNRLAVAERLVNLREQIPQGYFPKLDSLVASRQFPSRPPGLYLRDINREADNLQLNLSDMDTWRDRIFSSIQHGFVTNSQNQQIPLTEKDGIDILGNIIEASTISINPTYYGDLHNLGHVAIAYLHDPDHRYLESFGVMGDSATAMRDPLFYRWHAFINDIFMEHKNLLPPYKPEQLNFRGVEMVNVQIVTANQAVNNLVTFWNKSDVDLSRGLDFAPRGPLLARFTHLNHAPFSYRIQVNNRNRTPLLGTCRIFIGPKFDENGLPYTFRAQKSLMIEMDKFTVTLKNGINVIERQSNDSSVTIPFERTFRNLDKKRPTGGSTLEDFNFCGCGWPQHMLVPRGNTDGYPMTVFIMISDFRNDAVAQASPVGCADAVSYCGLRDRKYPDAQSMGFPFDRPPPRGVLQIGQFLTPNMAAIDVVIRFTNTVVPKPRSKTSGNVISLT
ncbi:hypothetical protein HCN44_004174 [Aphidius gifuensis]|uniref:Prophenoloxidase n=2 Tax=Aphidius gifuensis TaxID=684658 RepID=A0A834XZZ9_APHGI|nr:hypothetical protein HCN44_004174 [Aphidius gifuensis]